MQWTAMHVAMRNGLHVLFSFRNAQWTAMHVLFSLFAEGRGWCRKGLAAAIMAPRVFAHEGLPGGRPGTT